MKTKTGIALGVLSAVTAVVMSAHAQPKPPAPRLAPGARPAPVQPAVRALPVQLAPVTVDPQLKPALANKRTFDPSVLANRLSVQNGRPVLQIKSGRKYALEPLGAEPVPSPSLQIKQLPPQLSAFKAHVESPLVAGKRISKLADLAIGHQNSQTEIRDQGSRGTCTAFASIAGMEGWAKRVKAKTLDLSENHAFSLFMIDADKSCTVSGGYTTWKTGPVLSDKPVCAEPAMPYNGTACPAGIPVACQSSAVYKLGSTQHFFTPKYGGTGALRADNVNLLEAYLKAGYDIVYGVDVAGNDWSDGTLDSGVVDVQLNGSGDPVGGYGGHAMLLVGYNRTAGYFVFKNSWGADSGHDGYVRLSYDYVQVYGKYGYAVMDVNGPGL